MSSKPLHGGPTLMELLWQEMDATYLQLQMALRQKSNSGAPEARLRGECVGLAKALAIFSAPMTYDGVKAEAQRRYEGHTPSATTSQNKRELRRKQ